MTKAVTGVVQAVLGKIVALNNFAKLIGKHLCQGFFFQ